MKRLLALAAATAAFLGCPSLLTAQDAGNRTTELREVTAVELPRPAIPDIQIGDSPTKTQIPRPVYLVYRYYSCTPWYPFYIKDVFTNTVPRDQYSVQIDTAGAVNVGDNAEGQIVQDINHPAYGLYCLTVKVGIPWALWQPNFYHRWYIRWAYGAPYWCWHDHWWYYWQRRCVNVTLNAAQEVQTPPVNSPATGTSTVCIDQNGTVHYTVSFSGLTSGLTAAHFHGPADPGVNAGVIVGLNSGPVTGQTSGTMTGTISPNGALIGALQTGRAYINIHTSNFPNGEIRGQVPVLIQGPPIWCPWGPTWWPGLRWTRWGTAWGLTVYHPYCYAWNPLYIPRPFCLYGLRYYYTPIGNVRQPAQDPNHPNAVPLQNNLNLAALASRPWFIYDSVTIGGLPLRPPFYYWPFTPYCSRWYWYRCLPFNLYRYNPPVVQFAIWQNPLPTPVNNNFPDMPVNNLPGTMLSLTTRAQTVQLSDVTGDGLVNPADQSAFRAENGTQPIDSFFDVFVDIELN